MKIALNAKIFKLRWASVPPEFFFPGRVLYRVQYVEQFETLYMSMFKIRTRPFTQIVDDVIFYYIIGNKLLDSFEISDLIQLIMVIIQCVYLKMSTTRHPNLWRDNV